MIEIDLVQDWGISTSNSPTQNTNNFNSNFNSTFPNNNKDDYRLYLRPGTYNFNKLKLYTSTELQGIQFIGSGIGRTTIKFSNNSHTLFEVRRLKDFIISDISIDGANAIFEGGLWIKNNCKNGIIERVEVYDANAVSCVVTGSNTNDILIRDCVIYNQRQWPTNAKAMFLAGENAEYITFQNCRTFSKSKDGSEHSTADHFDSDNARYIQYVNCVANGEGSTGGSAFWNEGESPGETISSYHGCTAYKTHGGLAISQNSTARAFNMTFNDASSNGWTVWAFGAQASGYLLLDGALFKNCGSPVQNFSYGGIHIERNTVINNCRFIETPSGSLNISFYSPGDVLPNDTYAKITNCYFDKGVQIYSPSHSDGPTVRNILLENNTFKSDADLNIGAEAGKYRIVVKGCEFENTGMSIRNATNIRILENTFYDTQGGSTPAIETIDDVSGLVQSNVFSGYTPSDVIHSSGQPHQLDLDHNLF